MSDASRSKLSLKGDRDVKLTYQRQVPTFLKQYSHLLGSKRPDPRQEDEPQYERDNSKADGAQVVCSGNLGRESEDDVDEDFAKIRALYESEVPKQSQKTEVIVKSKTKSKEETEEEISDPSKKVVFKRKSAPSSLVSSSAVEIGKSIGDSVALEKNKKPKTVTNNLLSFDHDE
jgi:hypothetical protein